MAERFQISPLDGQGTMVLADDSSTAFRTIIVAPACLPAAEFMVQSVAPIRAENMKHIARGNLMSAYTFHCTRTHETLQKSLSFERDHITQVVAACAFGQLVLTRTVFSVRMQSIGALKRAACINRVGVHTHWQYDWVGSPFTA